MTTRRRPTANRLGLELGLGLELLALTLTDGGLLRAARHRVRGLLPKPNPNPSPNPNPTP
jgi:hypothetical protein